jgi:hypothetical protein
MKGNSDMYYNMDESWGHGTKGNKSVNKKTNIEWLHTCGTYGSQNH